MTKYKPKRADMDVRSSDDRVIVTDPSGSAVRTTAGAWDARWESVLARSFHRHTYIATMARPMPGSLYIGNKGTRWEGWSVAKDAEQDYVWE